MALKCWHDCATQRRQQARIYCDRQEASTLIIILDEPQFGIAAGQAAALYHGDDADILLGGGWISKAPLAADNDLPSEIQRGTKNFGSIS